MLDYLLDIVRLLFHYSFLQSSRPVLNTQFILTSPLVYGVKNKNPPSRLVNEPSSSSLADLRSVFHSPNILSSHSSAADQVELNRNCLQSVRALKASGTFEPSPLTTSQTVLRCKKAYLEYICKQSAPVWL